MRRTLNTYAAKWAGSLALHVKTNESWAVTVAMQ
jgi:hypothetical protein